MPALTQGIRSFALMLSICAVRALAACGGGGGTSAPSAPPATTGGTSPAGSPSSTGTSRTVGVVAHTFKADAIGSGTSPMTTPAITTPSSGSLILVQVLTQNPGTFAGLSDNKGNHYVEIGTPQTYAGGAGSELFACTDAVGGPDHSWALTKPPGYETNEASVYVVALAGSSGVGNWSYSGTSAYGGAPITTTAANSVVVSFWGPADYTGAVNTYTPPAAWIKGDSNVNSANETTGADAWTTVATAGTGVDPIWSAATAITDPTGSMWLVEAKP